MRSLVKRLVVLVGYKSRQKKKLVCVQRKFYIHEKEDAKLNIKKRFWENTLKLVATLIADKMKTKINGQ